MKKQKKQLVVLIGILAICLLSYFGISYYNELQEQKEAEEATKDIIYITDFDADDVTSLSYVYEDVTYSYIKDGDDWLYVGDTSLDMDESEFKTILYYVGCVTAEDKITEYEDLSEYGFEEPTNTIILTVSGEELVIKMGSENEMLDLYYLTVSGDNTLYLVDDTLMNQLDVTYEDLEYVPEETETVTEETETVVEDETTTEAESTIDSENSTELEVSVE